MQSSEQLQGYIFAMSTVPSESKTRIENGPQKNHMKSIFQNFLKGCSIAPETEATTLGFAAFKEESVRSRSRCLDWDTRLLKWN